MNSLIELVITSTKRSRAHSSAKREAYQDAVREGLQQAGVAIKPILQRRAIAQKAYWKGAFAYGWFYRTKRSGNKTMLTFGNRAKYAYVIELGRRPNRRPPPVAAIVEWVRDKLGPFVSPYVVARSIGIKGTPARPVLTDPDTQRDIQNIVDYSVGLRIQRTIKGQA